MSLSHDLVIGSYDQNDSAVGKTNPRPATGTTASGLGNAPLGTMEEGRQSVLS